MHTPKIEWCFGSPTNGDAKEVVMKTIEFLATLVAVCLVLALGGCYALTGECMGGGVGPQCTADGATYDTDGANADDGSVSKNDNSSTTETTVVETAPTVQEICKDFLYLEGTVWNCKWITNGPICTLGLMVLESGACGVRCPLQWKVQANTISFSPPDEMVLEPSPGSGPHTCYKVK